MKYVGDNAAYTGNYSAGTNGTEDIDDRANANNYSYDKIGNMTGDAAENITFIKWNVYGKILVITKNGADITYRYDAAGNRVSKTVAGVTTMYVRDASGNVMSVYELTGSNAPAQKELHVYGSSRLGMVTEQSQPPVEPEGAGTIMGYGQFRVSTFTRGEKIYELSNHLGNVLTTVSDRKLQYGYCARGGDCYLQSYLADVLSATDYYPFGMGMPGRTFSADGSYRYGFNGKENDNEVKGEGNQQDYGMRIYDPRLVRFLSEDPLTKKYPMLTPYQFASNSPISGVDLDGLEYYYAADGNLIAKSRDNNTQVRVVQAKDVASAWQFLRRKGGATTGDLNKVSTDVGMNNDELNTRATLDVMQKYEGGNSYYKWSGRETFKDEDIKSGHPGRSPIKTKQAAGAYQIQEDTWDDEFVGKKIRLKYEITDFSPESQDRFTVGLMKDKSKALDAIKIGDFESGYKKMSGVWRFLPGPKQQGDLKMETLLEDTKKAISEELKGNTKVQTPKGELLDDF